MIKPQWLDKKIDLGKCRRIKSLIKELNLVTVCEQARCPNISECFDCGTATFMILGDICTRGCSFCAVKKGQPRLPENDEPERIVLAIKKLGLRYTVITSPCRDDLFDFGAGQFIAVVERLKKSLPSIKVEILIPDFGGKKDLLHRVAHCGADVISHNIETVPSLYIGIRPGVDYQQSLRVLRLIKECNPQQITKSGLMLGLGEPRFEVIKVLKDLRQIDCDFLTLGQYLPPSREHAPVKEYITAEMFEQFKHLALNLGFKNVRAESYARSSYFAQEYFNQNNL